MNWLALLVTFGAVAAIAGGFALLHWAEKKIGEPKLGDPYPPEAAEAADFDEHTDDTLNVARAQPWTGDDDQDTVPLLAGSPAIVAGDDLIVSQLVGDLYDLIRAYRCGIDDVGGMRECSPLTRWTEQGWEPADWRVK